METKERMYYYVEYLGEIYLNKEDVEQIPLSGSADEIIPSIAEKEYILNQMDLFTNEQLENAVRSLSGGEFFYSNEYYTCKDLIEFIVWSVALYLKEGTDI